MKRTNRNRAQWVAVATIVAAALVWAVPVAAEDVNVQVPLPEEAGSPGATLKSTRTGGQGPLRRNAENSHRRGQPLRSSPRNDPEPAPAWRPELPPPGAEPREYNVVNPRGEMTQSWDRTVTEDGFTIRREQTWTAADGTPLRQHESTVTGTDPLNFQRDRTITLKDGRTIEHTYSQSWDGTSLQRERTFTGPNGQTRTWEQTSPEKPPAKTWKLFGDRSGAEADSGPPKTRPSGFTLGSGGHGLWSPSANGSSSRQPGQPDSSPSLLRRLRAQERHRTADRLPPNSHGGGKR